jgi:hypothetical protein
MNPMAIIATISSVVGMAQTAASLAKDVKPFVDILWNDIFGKDPQTEEEVAAVAATVKTKLEELRARLHLPLPPEQDDDV